MLEKIKNKVLIPLAFAGLLGTAAMTVKQLIEEYAPASISQAFSNPSPEVICYKTGKLAGMTLPSRPGSLLEKYTGLAGVVPSEVCIDYAERSRNLWNEKYAICLNEYHNSAQTDEDPKKHRESKFDQTDLQDTRRIMVQVGKYSAKTSTKKSIEQYVNEAVREVNMTSWNLDWKKTRAIKRLKPERLPLFKDVGESIEGQDLIAFSFTELYDVADPEANIAATDFILKTAGREYFERIPALFDPYLSYGPYQFTKLALNAETDEGASRINRALPRELQIPGRVGLLSNEQHHRAAYLYIINNIGNLIKHLNEKDYATFETYWKKNPKKIKYDLIKYVAVAHNAPAFAKEAIPSWIKSLRKYGIDSPNADFSRHVRQTREIKAKRYSLKAGKNLDGIYRQFPPQKIMYTRPNRDKNKNPETAKRKIKAAARHMGMMATGKTQWH